MVAGIFSVLFVLFAAFSLSLVFTHRRMERIQNRILAVLREGNLDYYRVEDIRKAYRVRWGSTLGKAMAYVALGNMDRQVEVEIVPGNGARYRLR